MRNLARPVFLSAALATFVLSFSATLFAQDDGDAWFGFNNRDLSPGPPFGVELPDLAAVQRMPTVMDRHIPIDMGRMNPRWPWDVSHGCSPVPIAEASEPPRCIH